MAERRMFNRTLLFSNRFTALPKNAQLLYIYLNLQADDDGICSNTTVVCRMCGFGRSALQTLLDQGWLIGFDSGITAITHWRVHNQIRKDRYKPSIYGQLTSRLRLDADGVYSLCPDGCHLVDDLATQDRIGKDRIDKDRIDKDRRGQPLAPEDDVHAFDHVHDICRQLFPDLPEYSN